MGKGNKTSVPDPAATAAAQGAANKETAIAQAGLNNVNQTSPLGSLTYKQIGTWADGTPRYEATTSLTDQGQQLYDSQLQYQQGLSDLAGDQVGNIRSNLSQPFTYDGMPAAPDGSQAFLQQAGDALYNQATSRLDPQWETKRRQTETLLANKGITDPNSEAYKRAMQDLQFAENDAYTSARNAATANASSAAQAQFGMQSTARQNAIQEALAARELPINEAAALMGNSGGVTMPQFSNLGNTSVGQTDVIGAYNTAQNARNQNAATAAQGQNALLGALAGLGGAAIFASDRRLKQNITYAGALREGINLYHFRYLDDPENTVRIGVMADEVQSVRPDLVHMMPEGYMAVDYAGLGVA